MAFTFEWDPKKAAANARKHGVTFDEAATAFNDPFGRVVDDPRHSGSEPRAALLAYSQQRRLLAVMFTERSDRIRLISARKATRREHQAYEEGAR
ncbi:MAG: BrnT family toxin [Gemmatimonadales bacterium]